MFQDTILKLLSNKVAVNLKMFGAHMEDKISSNMKHTLVVTIKDMKLRERDVTILKQVENTLKLTSS